MFYYEESGKISNIKQTVKNHMSADDWFLRILYIFFKSIIQIQEETNQK